MAIIVCDTRKSGPTFASYNIYGTNTIDKERICKKCLVKVVYFSNTGFVLPQLDTKEGLSLWSPAVHETSWLCYNAWYCVS